MEPLFDHEKLDVYWVELQFAAWIADFLSDVSGSVVQHRRELVEQLDRASLSMLLQHGRGKRQASRPPPAPNSSTTPVARLSSAPLALTRQSPDR